MKPPELLRELERLTHDAQMRRMVEVGRLASADGSVAATLDALERGTVYERHLAVASCFGSRDGARVLRALGDPSRMVRGVALRLVALVCDDAQAGAALDVLPLSGRHGCGRIAPIRRRWWRVRPSSRCRRRRTGGRALTRLASLAAPTLPMLDDGQNST